MQAATHTLYDGMQLYNLSLVAKSQYVHTSADPQKPEGARQERASAGAHSLAVLLGVVRRVHHFEAVVLLQHGRVIANTLNEQVLPAPMEAIPLRPGTPLVPSSLPLDTGKAIW